MALKRVAFKTFGCRLNQYDTETLRTLLVASGRYETVPAHAEAEFYVVNTCSVTARADAAARKAIRRIRAAHPDAKIVVVGCYAQRAPNEISEIPGVSLVVGAADRADIVREVGALETANDPAPRIAVSPIEAARTFLDVPITQMMERSRAFVKVQEGCNESCSFCIIPQTRGVSRSRDPASVLDQVARLVDSGYVEIVATGVHIGDFGLDLPRNARLLARLIREILDIPGLQRFRLSSIEPASVTDELIELMAGSAKFARHFHIPLQSGSDPVLRRMRRRYRAGDFIRLIERIAERVPGCGIGTDIICGFPGESDDDFQQTFECIESLPITYVHAFTYSVRPGSQAQGFSGQVPAELKKRRTRSLRRLSLEKSQAARVAALNQVVEILPESESRHPQTLRRSATGWTDNYLRVRVDDVPTSLAPELHRVRVSALGETELIGALA